MKCAEPYPESSYQECQLDLGHSGSHDYLGTKWARLEPGELAPDVEDLIEAGAKGRRTCDMDEREYPVLVEVTQRYVKWVSAPSEDDALEYWADDPTDMNLDSADVIDSDLEVQRIDRHLATEAFRSRHTQQHIGPQIQCPDCGKQAFRREWYHDPYRRCHGPIEWHENTHARALQWRYSREYQATPIAVTA